MVTNFRKIHPEGKYKKVEENNPRIRCVGVNTDY